MSKSNIKLWCETLTKYNIFGGILTLFASQTSKGNTKTQSDYSNLLIIDVDLKLGSEIILRYTSVTLICKINFGFMAF